ncbi:MAG: CBS domain-containing protein [Candidatus Omnitrophica bacterium]|nr:CBS domain-containing protein [Candidatus Omnitrophota bacterium]
MQNTFTDKNPLNSLMDKVRLKDVMDKSFSSVYDDQDLSIALGKFLNRPISHLLVLDRFEKLSGILTPKYLYKTHSPQKIINDTIEISREVMIDGDTYFNKNSLNSYILRSIMKKDPLTLGPEDSLSAAILSMKRNNLSCIPVVNNDLRVLGIVTNTEIVDFLSCLIK